MPSFKYLFFKIILLALCPVAQSIDYLNREAVSVSGNWKQSGWFGYYHDGGSGWIYHQDLGWIYPSSPDGNSSWLYLNGMDWAWTRSDFYPWAYFQKLEDWRYYHPHRGFYDDETKIWEIRNTFFARLDAIDNEAGDNTGGQESNSTSGQNDQADSNQSRLIYYFLSISSGPGGSVTGGGRHLEGNSAGISAFPDTGYQFLNWTGDIVADSNATSTTVIMDRNRSVTANFAIEQRVLSVIAGPGGSATGENEYDYGSSATVTAIANTGYQFESWTGEGLADNNASITTVTMDRNRSVTANFAIEQRNLSVIAGPGGSATGGNKYDYGSLARVTAIANTGYQFESWTGEGVADNNATITTVTMDRNRSVTANFVIFQPMMSLSAGVGGSVSGGGRYSYDANVTVVAVPDSGFRFLNWSGARVVNSSSATTIIKLTADSNLTATFETLPANSSGKVEPYEMVRRMGRGINLGNVLSAPEEGRWAPAATEQYFIDLAEANFTNVRIPMDFYGSRTSGDTSTYSALANTSGDFNGSMDDFVVSSTYLDRIEQVVTWSLNRGLITVLDLHGGDLKTEFLHTFNSTNSHYIEPTSARRAADMMKFNSIWRAIATRFRDYAPELIFEIVNEPYFELSSTEMDVLNSGVIPVIRATGGNNTYRNLIIVGGGENSYLAPQQINPVILAGDGNLIATFHYYDPFKFTSSQRDQYDNNTWGTAEEILSVKTHFDSVKNWSDLQGVPIYLGEFGADNANGFDYGSGTLRKINSNASGYADGGPDVQSRVLYHRQVAHEAINRGFSFSAWDSGPTSNKTIHKRSDSNQSSNFDFNSFSVTTFEPPSVSVSTNADTTTWVSEIKSAILQGGTWPECYGPEGLVKNPGFGCSPFDQGWSLKLVSNSSAQLTMAGATNARTGNSAAKVMVSSDLGHNKVMLENRPYVSDLNGKRVTVEVWVKSVEAAEFRLQLKVIAQTGVEYGQKFPSSDVFTAGSEYQRYIFRHTVGGAIESIQVKVLMGNAPAIFYIDDLSFSIDDL